MKTRYLTGAALLLSLASSGAYAGDAIVFDPDGGGGLTQQDVDAFDWLQASAVAVDAIPTGSDLIFQLYSHGELGNITLNGSNQPSGNLGIDYEITFVLGTPEKITAVTSTFEFVSDNGTPLDNTDDTYRFIQSASFGDPLPGDDVSGFDNFFAIYYDDVADSDPLAGTNFNDGTLILLGTISNISGNLSTILIEEFNPANDAAPPTVFDAANDTIVDTGWDALDQTSNGDNLSDVNTDVLTVPSRGPSGGLGGSTTLEVDVLYTDPDFFITGLANFLIDLSFNTSNILPFDTTDPSQSFDTALTCTDVSDPSTCTYGTAHAPVVGDGADGADFLNVANTTGAVANTAVTGSTDGKGDRINGIEGPDILFQTDANMSFTLTQRVPEPSSLILLGFGLGVLGMVPGLRSRRRSSIADAA